MKKALKVFSIIAGVISLMLIAAAIIIKDFNIEIEEKMVKEKTDEYMPFVIDKEKFDLTILNLNVEFTDNGEKGEVEGKVEFKMETLGRYLIATTNISSGISYKNSSFYLLEPKFSDFEIEETEYTEKDKEIFGKVLDFGNKHKDKANKILNGAKNFFNNNKEEKGSEFDYFEPEFIKKKSIETLKNNISNFPIYTLEGDAKKTAASMILKDVYFKEDVAYVTLSVSKFVGQLFLYIFAGVLALLAGLGQLFLFLSGRSSIGITDAL